jgi:hypothetical protein
MKPLNQNKMRQETLEQAAENYTKDGTKHFIEKTNVELGFIAGAKWQAEKMYSEEDFKLFARQFYREIKLDKSNLLWDELADKCLEQFKKK